jgi:protein O-mannosyl-transferase
MATKNKPKQNNPAAPRPAAAKEAAPAMTTQFFTGFSFWRKYWLPALALMVASLGLYNQAARFGYVLDDEIVIWKNAYVQDGFSGIKKIFGADSFMGYFQKKEDLYRLPGGRYRPMSLATFAVEIGLWGKPESEKTTEKAGENRADTKTFGRGIPEYSHVVNILMYGLLGVLLMQILAGLFAGDRERPWWFSVAFFGAAIFVFHPLHTEAVANIKGRDEIIALLGGLGALYASMRYFDTRKFYWQIIAAVAMLIGLFSKENTLTMIPIIPLTIWWFGRSNSGGRPTLANCFSGTWLLWVAAAIFIFMRYQALGYMVDHGKVMPPDLMNDSFLGMKMGEKLATIFLTLGWYIKLLFFPYPLTHDYYPYHVPKVNWSDWRAFGSLALYVGLGIWSLRAAKSRSVTAYAFIFFVATISIVSNLFVSVGSFMNERFAFMPSVAFCLLAGWFLAEKLPQLIKNEPGSPNLLGTILLLAGLGAGAWATIDRVPDWATGFALNESAVRRSPNSARAQSFYTSAIYNERYMQTKEPAEKAKWVDTMEVHVKKALEIYPDYGSAWVMRANVAFARFETDIQMDKLFNELTLCIEKAPYVTMLKNNVLNYLKYFAQNGGNPLKVNAFGYRIGYEYYYKKLKNPQLAMEYMEKAILTGVPDERLYAGLAEVYDALGKPEQAARIRALPLN